jgi:hypothetical protein
MVVLTERFKNDYNAQKTQLAITARKTTWLILE